MTRPALHRESTIMKIKIVKKKISRKPVMECLWLVDE